MTANQPITQATAIQFNDSLPKAVDVVIIGAGVIGIFSALYLARLGKRVLVCEKGRVAAEQSSRNWGWIRQHGRDEAELPIATQAGELWRQVDQQTDGACGVKQHGLVYLAKDQQRLERLHAWLDIAKAHNLDSHALTQTQIAKMFPHSANQDWLGGVCTPSDAKAEPWQAVPAVAHLAHSEGVLIKENCAVRDIIKAAGSVTGVATEQGLVQCEQVVLCGGAWSSLLARRLGIYLPQLTVDATVAQTVPMDLGFNYAMSDGKLAMRRRDDGGFSLATTDSHGIFVGADNLRFAKQFLPLLRKSWHVLQFKGLAPKHYSNAWSYGGNLHKQWHAESISPFEKMRVMAPQADAKRLLTITQRFNERFPQQPSLVIKKAWSGMIDAMPDMVPTVDAVTSLSDFYIATGMSAHGFGIGPGYGRIIARMLTGLPAEHDLSRFRLSRFVDGSELVVGPAL